MVVIKKRDNVIPVDFGDFQLSFVTNDESMKSLARVKKQLEKFEKEVKTLNKDDVDEEYLVESYEKIKQLWLELFSEEDFNKVYEFSDQDSDTMFVYLIQVILGIANEQEKRNSEDELSKYLDVKK